MNLATTNGAGARLVGSGHRVPRDRARPRYVHEIQQLFALHREALFGKAFGTTASSRGIRNSIRKASPFGIMSYWRLGRSHPCSNPVIGSATGSSNVNEP